MLKRGTRVKVADNSGAIEVELFGILGGTGKDTAHIGDFVRAAVKRIIPNNKIVKKGEVVKCLVVRTKYASKNHDGGFSNFGENAVILLKNNNELRGTKVKGLVSRAAFENKDQTVKKILHLCESVC